MRFIEGKIGIQGYTFEELDDEAKEVALEDEEVALDVDTPNIENYLFEEDGERIPILLGKCNSFGVVTGETYLRTEWADIPVKVTDE